MKHRGQRETGGAQRSKRTKPSVTELQRELTVYRNTARTALANAMDAQALLVVLDRTLEPMQQNSTRGLRKYLQDVQSRIGSASRTLDLMLGSGGGTAATA